MKTLFIIGLSLLIVGCGYRGDLYLPKKTAVKNNSSAPAVESNTSFIFESSNTQK